MFGTIVAVSVVLILLVMVALEFVDTSFDERRLASGPVRKVAKTVHQIVAPKPAYQAEPLPLKKAA